MAKPFYGYTVHCRWYMVLLRTQKCYKQRPQFQNSCARDLLANNPLTPAKLSRRDFATSQYTPMENTAMLSEIQETQAFALQRRIRPFCGQPKLITQRRFPVVEHPLPPSLTRHDTATRQLLSGPRNTSWGQSSRKSPHATAPRSYQAFAGQQSIASCLSTALPQPCQERLLKRLWGLAYSSSPRPRDPN